MLTNLYINTNILRLIVAVILANIFKFYNTEITGLLTINIRYLMKVTLKQPTVFKLSSVFAVGLTLKQKFI